jgi:hypothetical protein
MERNRVVENEKYHISFANWAQDNNRDGKDKLLKINILK